MMDERLVTKLLGVGPEYEVTQMEELEGGLRLHLEVRAKAFVCPGCGSMEVSRKGRRHRELQTVPIGLSRIYLRTEVPDCQCRDCGARFELSPPLPPPIEGSPIEWYSARRTSHR